MSPEPKILPEIKAMLETEGLYLVMHPSQPKQGVPIWVQSGQAFSMQVDSPLCPTHFPLRYRFKDR